MTKIIGVDLGSTFTKLAWEETVPSNPDANNFCFATSKESCTKQTIEVLVASGFDTAKTTGINEANEKDLAPLSIVKLPGDRIENELQIQATGARKLLELSGRSDIQDFLLISIGTGTSYTLVKNKKAIRYPLGNGIGGGFVDGIFALSNTPLYMAADKDLLKEGGMFERRLYDKQLKDIIPGTSGSFLGELVVAHFGNVSEYGPLLSKDNIAATTLNCVATSIVRDVAKMDLMPLFEPPKHVIFVGSLSACSPVLRTFITKLFANIGQIFPWWKNHEAVFPQNGEYAGALGALLYGK